MMQPTAWAILVAFPVSFILATIAALIGHRGESPVGPRWGATAGLGLGYALGHAVFRRWYLACIPDQIRTALTSWARDGGSFPYLPNDKLDWLPTLALAAMVLGLLDGTIPSPRWARWENRLIVSGSSLALILAPLFAETWGLQQAAGWSFGLVAGMIAFWAVLDARAERLGSAMPSILLLLSITTAVTLGLSHSLVLASLGGVLAASMGAIWLVSLVNRRMGISHGLIPGFATIHSGLLLVGVFYSELPRASALALTVAPLATFVDRLGPIARMSPWKRSAIRCGVMLIPLGVAVGVAIAMRPKEEDTGGY